MDKKKTFLRRKNRTIRAKSKGVPDLERQAAVRTVVARATGRCEVCGVALRIALSGTSSVAPTGGDIHEIVPRWKGRKYLIDPDNLLLVCFKCHAKIENGEYPQLKRSLPDD